VEAAVQTLTLVSLQELVDLVVVEQVVNSQRLLLAQQTLVEAAVVAETKTITPHI
jgi:hypothetical protein